MIEWFTRHPTAANLMMVMIFVLGLQSLPSLQRESFPQIQNSKVSILVVYPGAVAADVEDSICRRIEDAVESIGDLKEIQCEAAENKATATAEMYEGSDMSVFLDDIKSAIDAISDFPDSVEKPVITEKGRTDAVASIAITGIENPSELKAYANDVKLRLLDESNISEVVIKGFSTHQLRVEINADRLRQLNMSVADIATAMKNQSINLPSGSLQSDQGDVLLRFDDQSKTLEQLGDIVVASSSSGAFIHLRDIAKIKDLFENPETKIVFNGQRAAVLNVSKTKTQDILKALASIKSFIKAEQQRVPKGIHLNLTQDQASVVQDRLDLIYSNGIQGIVMVFLVLWLFFSLRYSFWVTMGLPVSFLGALFLIPFFGMTINMISLVGLLIGVGLLMDDAIVISENIASKIEKGLTPLNAAIEGTKQVMPGVMSSFATTLMIFGSLAFITGDIGQILRVMPIVLIIVISVSLLEAFFILPNHLSHSLEAKKEQAPSGFKKAFEAKFEHFRHHTFGNLLDKAVHYRYATVGIIIMFFLMAIAAPVGGFLKFVGFPPTEGNIVEARILLPQGTPLSLTEQRVESIYQAALATGKHFSKQQPKGESLVQNTTIIYSENPDAYETGPHVARMIIDLLNTEIRGTSIDEFTTQWRKTVGDLPDIIEIKYTQPSHGPGGRDIEIRIEGDSIASLKAPSLDLQHWLKQFNGVVNIGDDTRPGKREIRVHLKDSAGVLGVNASMVANQIHSAFQGVTIDKFPVGDETFEVDLRLAARDRKSIDQLKQFTVTGPKGVQIPLPNIAEFEELRGWARINRINRKPTLTVYGDVIAKYANSQEILSKAAKDIFPKLRQQYPNIKIEVKGASSNNAETGRSIIRNVGLGILGLYILLSIQFKSYAEPFTVMALIPAAFIGVVFGHLVLGLDLTMPSIIGMASLFGVVVNDSILLVVFMREAHQNGESVVEAAKHAGRARFRAILLTSLTTVAGLVPLLMETSVQAQILIPLAASLAFGLSFATIIALFLVPAIYCIVHDHRRS